jgi:hypothetical protein
VKAQRASATPGEESDRASDDVVVAADDGAQLAGNLGELPGPPRRPIPRVPGGDEARASKIGL